MQAIGNRGYVADNDTAEVVVTLPVSPAFGDLIQVYGLGAGGWRIAQNAGQLVVTPHLYGEGGTVWTARAPNRSWQAVASSSDGQRLVAAATDLRLYTSAPMLRESTTAGAAGSISGRQYEVITLQYVGANKFVVVDFTGDLIVK